MRAEAGRRGRGIVNGRSRDRGSATRAIAIVWARRMLGATSMVRLVLLILMVAGCVSHAELETLSAENARLKAALAKQEIPKGDDAATGNRRADPKALDARLFRRRADA